MSPNGAKRTKPEARTRLNAILTASFVCPDPRIDSDFQPRDPQARGFFSPQDVAHLARVSARGVLNSPLKNEMGDRMMRVFFALAIVITAAIGLGGCFHHNQAVYAEPISHPPLK